MTKPFTGNLTSDFKSLVEELSNDNKEFAELLETHFSLLTDPVTEGEIQVAAFNAAILSGLSESHSNGETTEGDGD